MKASKLTFLAAMALGSVLALGTALAADTNAPTSTPPAGGPPGGGAGRMRGPSVEQISQQLNLNEDQKPKVKEALESQMQKMRDLRQDQSLSQEDRRAKMQSMREELNAKMKGILTDEQYGKWEKMGMNLRGTQRGPRAGTNAPAGGTPPPQN